nr:hypothetical protein [Lentilactobacillus rapi]
MGTDDNGSVAKTAADDAGSRSFFGLIKQNQGALLSGLSETMWLTVVSIFLPLFLA